MSGNDEMDYRKSIPYDAMGDYSELFKREKEKLSSSSDKNVNQEIR